MPRCIGLHGSSLDTQQLATQQSHPTLPYPYPLSPQASCCTTAWAW